jgi:hypothetical protein
MVDSTTMLRAIQRAISEAAGGHGATSSAYTVLDPLMTLTAEILAQGPAGMRDEFVERLDIAIALQRSAVGARFLTRADPS